MVNTLSDWEATDDNKKNQPPSKETTPDEVDVEEIRKVIRIYLREIELPQEQRNLSKVVGQKDLLQRSSTLDILTDEDIESLKQNKSSLARKVLIDAAIRSEDQDKKTKILEWILLSKESGHVNLQLVLNYLSINYINEEIDAHLLKKAKLYLKKQKIQSWGIGLIVARSGRFPELTDLLKSQLKDPLIPDEIKELIINNASQLFPQDWKILLQEDINLGMSPRLRSISETALTTKPSPYPALSDVSETFVVYEDKFRAALMGHAIGDAYGNSLEILKRHEMREDILGEANPYPQTIYSYEDQGTTTDDTVLALLLLQNFIRNQGFRPENYATLLGKYQNKVDLGQAPDRHFSANTAAVLRRIHLGYSLDRSGRASLGNGSILRCLPISMITMNTEEEKKAEIIRDTVRFSHNSEKAINAANLVVKIQQHLFNTKQLDADELLNLIKAENTDEEMTTKIDLVRQLIHDNETEHEVVQNALGTSSKVHESLPFAIYCFFRSKDFNELMKLCCYVDGDSDSIAALAGSFWGALHGMKGIPVSYIAQLDCREHIEKAIELKDGEYWY
ncbi:hypothetical protein CVV38_04350 [Candidatus Peregrinibacteria bacterium HGW-Peregrinibacteria-1]|jgi:ADP-ribosyl-[dinitrogen reductase] hydrolase|nr:MAG: hypothetical protein CVV38_04350 [Candidatus Peregrinibacteria bacterium HGW-Peregrinibacteria-1]